MDPELRRRIGGRVTLALIEVRKVPDIRRERINDLHARSVPGICGRQT